MAARHSRRLPRSVECDWKRLSKDIQIVARATRDANTMVEPLHDGFADENVAIEKSLQ
jgi:hypothetical protein